MDFFQTFYHEPNKKPDTQISYILILRLFEITLVFFLGSTCAIVNPPHLNYNYDPECCRLRLDSSGARQFRSVRHERRSQEQRLLSPLTDHDMGSKPALLKPSVIFSIAFNH